MLPKTRLAKLQCTSACTCWHMEQYLPGCAFACCTPSGAGGPHSCAAALQYVLLQPAHQHPANNPLLQSKRHHSSIPSLTTATVRQSAEVIHQASAAKLKAHAEYLVALEWCYHIKQSSSHWKQAQDAPCTAPAHTRVGISRQAGRHATG